jgi:hypothetical protein
MTEDKPKLADSKTSTANYNDSSDKSKRRSSSGKATVDPSRVTSAPSSSKSASNHPSKHSKTGSSSYASKASNNSAKLLVDPASHLSADEKINRVLSGETHIISYPGTSQYSQGAPSACGLAAINSIRLAFDKPLQGVTGVGLVKVLSSLDTHLVSDRV